MSDSFETPMMQQYLELKKAYADCLLLFRLGDFYELFLEDAKIGSEVLDITLTSRDRGADGRIPMAGVPYHALDSYLHKLIKAGYKVAICEQMSEPDPKKKLVEREVVRVVTPGTTLDAKTLDKKENNYIISLSHDGKVLGIAVADISTGAFFTNEFKIVDLHSQIKHELQKYNPSECVLPEHIYNDPLILKTLSVFRDLNTYKYSAWYEYAQDARSASSFLQAHFKLVSLRTFSIHNKPHAAMASAALLGYLKDTQKSELVHIKKITDYGGEDVVILDPATVFNLELFSTIREKDIVGSLIHTIDKTSTAMGSRMLKNWLRNPLHNKEGLERRYELVEYFNTNRFEREALCSLLTSLLDIERLVSRLSVGIGNARDLVNLCTSLKTVLDVKVALSLLHQHLAKDLHSKIPPNLASIVTFLKNSLVDNPPIDTKMGGMIRDGVNSELDALKSIINESNIWVNSFEQSERIRTGINSLKVKFNKVFGYYIEISKANLSSVPANYFRKQTMVNAERYITPELKEHEQRVLSADEQLVKMEYQLFTQIVSKVLEDIVSIQESAEAISALDCILSFSTLSQSAGYTRPVLNTTGILEIKDGRHPVVEQFLENNLFVPNDLYLNSDDTQLMLITGPNMAGKSVYIRQNALIVLLAHIGCYVPAVSATIPIVDRIFVRSGASDVITQGLSTFMIEMLEAGYILNHATKDSFIVLDELGRGTSTYDGISIASSIAEYITTKIHAKTLFATHYHELQELADKYSQVVNFQVAVKQEQGTPIFLHKVVSGGASHSFGISVAELAGLPVEVITNAKSLLIKLEGGKSDSGCK